MRPHSFVAGAAVLAVTAVISGCGGTPVGATSAGSFALRPLLCYAPPYSAASSSWRGSGSAAIPVCAPTDALTATNLGVAPNATAGSGYTLNDSIPVDAGFAGVPSTAAADQVAGRAIVAAPAPSAGTRNRFVLGPAGVTSRDVASAAAVHPRGAPWTVDVVLTSAGAPRWDDLARRQFHAYVAIVVNGQVVSAPLVQPTNAVFTSFGGELQISGNFDAATAQGLARAL